MSLRRFALAAAAFALAACDSGPEPSADPAAALLGTWTVSDVQYREFFTPAEAVTVLSRYEPAGDGVAVPALSAAPLRYVVGAMRSGTTCAAPPCLDDIELSNAPRTLDGTPTRLAPGETELRLRIVDGAATLYAVGPGGEDRVYGTPGPVSATRTPTSITVPDFVVNGPDGAIEVRGGRLEIPTQSFAAGAEASAMPSVAVGEGFVGEMTVAFFEGGGVRVERPFREAEVGTWTIEGGELAVSVGVWSTRGDASAPALRRVETCAVPSSCAAVFSRTALLVPNGALSGVRLDWTYALSKNPS